MQSTEATGPNAAVRKRYELLSSDRTVYLQRARACALLTIPTIMPPEGSGPATALPSPWQSVGARGVNHLASKLLLAMFPPSAPFFKVAVDELTAAKLTGDKNLKADIDAALGVYERVVMNEFEAYAMRVALFEALKLLIVTGNALLFVNPKGGIRVFRLDRYVVKRDAMGNMLEIIIREQLSPMQLSERGKAALAASGAQVTTQADETQVSVDLYTRIYRDGGVFRTYQEVEGSKIAGTDAVYPLDRLPFLALRWTAIHGEDYGRSYCDEYYGDLRSLEGLTRAIVTGSAAAAKVLFLLRPNAVTKAKDLTESESGDVKNGNPDDVKVVQMEKYNDFRVADQARLDIKQTLSLAFLLSSAVQRNGERVTAEEIRYMAEELESSLGGIYSALSQSLQKALIEVLIAQMERAGKLPVLPKGVVKVAIVTGIEAIGRGQDLNKLRAFMVDATQIAGATAQLQPYVNISNLLTRLATGHYIDTAGLVNPEEVVQRNLAQQQQLATAQSMTPQLIKTGGDIAGKVIDNQGEQ